MTDFDPLEIPKHEREADKWLLLTTGSDAIQDGMLAYFKSQVKLSDAYIEDLLAKSHFDCRDELKIKKR